MTTTLPTAIRSRTRTVPSRWSCTTASSASISLPVRMSWWTRFSPADHLKASFPYALRSVHPVLPPTENALHAASYAQTPYLYSGFGSRLLCDFTLYLKQYASKIDFEKIHSWCQESKIFHLYELILGSCHLYFGLSASIDPQIRSSAADCAAFLEQILRRRRLWQ